MKPLPLLALVLSVVSLISCDKDPAQDLVEVTVARPLTMTVEDFNAAVEVLPPRPIQTSGKIYAYQSNIFVNEPGLGVHLIDNADPSAPQKSGFIRIPGNMDISIKGDYLFADSLRDLVVLDISDPGNVRPVTRLTDVLEGGIAWPVGADFIEATDWDPETEVLVGWEQTTEMRPADELEFPNFDDTAVAEMAGSETGQGGSLARFKIVGDYLYAVDWHSINVFDISNLEAPLAHEDVFAGFDIETIFNRGDHLFLGSMRGMYIYDISDPSAPSFVSEFQHGTACDPVVVDGEHAYITLRGGNACGAMESGLFIVDIADLSRPELLVSYPMDEPYGLGIREDLLFVCDGTSGLKVYDRTDVMELALMAQFEEVFAYDVIPLADQLLMVGEGTLVQYAYQEGSLQWLSSLQLRE